MCVSSGNLSRSTNWSFGAMAKIIIRNRFICRRCGSLVESKFPNKDYPEERDFEYCSCGNWAYGGTKELGRGGNLHDLTDMNILKDI